MTELHQFNFSQEVFSEKEIEDAFTLVELVKEGSKNDEMDITIPLDVHDWACLDGAEHKASCIYLLDQVQRKNKK